ncbi:MAG: PD40 domain-containing protein [Myxococcaceae bacterium]|nr:PD40 domain-containing protein [Myxococcaceae bacterium]
MLKRAWFVVTVVAIAGSLACELPDDGGGGGGIGISNFTHGFVFVRADDRNVYAADKSTDYQEIAQLTENGNNKHPSLSHSGRSVVFVHSDATSTSIQTVLLAGGTPSTVLVSDAEKSKFASPVFSPDDSKIVFTYERGGSTYLGVVDVTGANFRELTSGTLSFASPSFMPDGKSVLAAAGNLGSGFTQLATVDIDSGTFTSVLGGLGNEALDIRNRVVVSADGTRAVFDGTVANNSSRIFVANLSTGNVTQLTDYPGDPGANDSFPTWVSSGEVAFSSDTGGNDQVYTIAVTATKQAGNLRLPSAVEPWFGP